MKSGPPLRRIRKIRARPAGITRLPVFAKAFIVITLLQHHPRSTRQDPPLTADAGRDRKISRRLSPSQLGVCFIHIEKSQHVICVAPPTKGTATYQLGFRCMYLPEV